MFNIFLEIFKIMIIFKISQCQYIHYIYVSDPWTTYYVKSSYLKIDFVV